MCGLLVLFIVVIYAFFDLTRNIPVENHRLECIDDEKREEIIVKWDGFSLMSEGVITISPNSGIGDVFTITNTGLGITFEECSQED